MKYEDKYCSDIMLELEDDDGYVRKAVRTWTRRAGTVPQLPKRAPSLGARLATRIATR